MRQLHNKDSTFALFGIYRYVSSMQADYLMGKGHTYAVALKCARQLTNK